MKDETKNLDAMLLRLENNEMTWLTLSEADDLDKQVDNVSTIHLLFKQHDLSPTLIECKNIWIDRNGTNLVYMIMSPCALMTLKKFITHGLYVNPARKKIHDALRQLFLAMSQHKLCHGNLVLENIVLITPPDSNEIKLQVIDCRYSKKECTSQTLDYITLLKSLNDLAKRASASASTEDQKILGHIELLYEEMWVQYSYTHDKKEFLNIKWNSETRDHTLAKFLSESKQ
jgi:hypothetical protein